MPTRLSSLRPAARLRAIFEEIQDINGQRASLGMAPVDPFGGLDFGTAPAEAPAAVPFLSFPLRNPPAAQDQGEAAFETARVRLSEQPFRQLPVPQRRLSPDEVSEGFREARRGVGSIIGSGDTSADDLTRQNDLFADENEVIEAQADFEPGLKTQSQIEEASASRRRRMNGRPQKAGGAARLGATPSDEVLLVAGAKTHASEKLKEGRRRAEEDPKRRKLIRRSNRFAEATKAVRKGLPVYNTSVLRYVASLAPNIKRVSEILNVPPVSIAGSIAEEFDSIQRANIVKSIGNRFLDVNTEMSFSHQMILDDYREVSSDEFDKKILRKPGVFDKASHVTLRDLGPGNIKLKTAIDLLGEYIENNRKSDPLDLKKYVNRLDLLAKDLIKENGDATVKFAGLMARQAKRFFRFAASEDWDSFSADEKDALIVTYYNLGRDRILENFLKLREFDEVYSPGIGDGGVEHLHNSKSIRSAYNRGIEQR